MLTLQGTQHFIPSSPRQCLNSNLTVAASLEVCLKANITRNPLLIAASHMESSKANKTKNPRLIAASPEEGPQGDLTRNNPCHFYIIATIS